MLKYCDNWGGLSAEHKPFWEEMENLHMPSMGKCKSVGGELIRAMDRIIYRFYNDGDTVLKYYGGMYNYLVVCDEFLHEKVPNYVRMDGIDASDEVYETILATNANTVAEYLMKHPELFEEENTFDCTEGGPRVEDDWDEDEW